MRYFIAHIIGGEAGEYHRSLADQIAKITNRPSVNLIYPPHLTLKVPFETTESMDGLKTLLTEWAKNAAPATVTLGGFNSFADRVIFMDVSAPAPAQKLQWSMIQALRHLPWLTFGRHDGEHRYHATLVYPADGQQSEGIKSYLSTQPVREFPVTIDSVALFRREPDRYEIEATFPLTGPI